MLKKTKIKIISVENRNPAFGGVSRSLSALCIYIIGERSLKVKQKYIKFKKASDVPPFGVLAFEGIRPPALAHYWAGLENYVDDFEVCPQHKGAKPHDDGGHNPNLQEFNQRKRQNCEPQTGQTETHPKEF